MIPKTLQTVLADSRVCEIVDERRDDNGYWVYFNPGWINPETETHSIHETTIAEIKRQLRGMVPCECEWNCLNR